MSDTERGEEREGNGDSGDSLDSSRDEGSEKGLETDREGRSQGADREGRPRDTERPHDHEGENMDDRPKFEGVPAIGVIVSTVALAGLAVPVRRGVYDPAVVIGTVFALLSLLSFLGRRHGALSRERTGQIAGIGSLGVVIVSIYALNQGIYGWAEVPGVDASISLVLVGFLAAGLGIGIAVSEYVGLKTDQLVDRTVYAIGLTILGVGGLFAPEVATLFLALPATLVMQDISQTQSIVLTQAGKAIGITVLVLGYLKFRHVDRSFIDLRVPSKRDLGFTVAGIVLIFGVAIVIEVLTSLGGIESAAHTTELRAQEHPELMLVMIPAALFIIGPFEELLYRNVIQKALYDRFSRYGAVVVASVIFAAVHLLAYATAGTGAIIAGLGMVFCFSLILGAIYERTDNLLVPAIVHGLNNAIVFAGFYYVYA